VSHFADVQQPGTDRIIFEPTSGNTGVGIAMLAAERGYEFIAVISEGMTIERRQTMALLGAKFIVTEGSKGTNWAIEKAYEMAAENPQYLLLDQFNNPANTEAHYTTTGPEILRDVPEITHFVGGMGTGGTLMGVHQYMKEHKPEVKIIGLEPMIGTKIQGLRKMEGFIPGIYHEDRLDEKIALDDEEALRVTRELGTREGIFAGISSGAAMWGAMQVAAQLDEGTIMVVLPDYGERYLSSPLFHVEVGSILPEIL
jgi:cysteine synthase